tara:strand:- start:167 stop:550 length:384 start_codon:yes stop_codon:yes gene_type:complete
MVIDFTKKKLLTESWLRMFGEWNKEFLKYVYGKDVKMHAQLGAHQMMGNLVKEEEDDSQKLKFVIRGEQQDVEAYAKAIFAEKEYLDCYVQYGTDHPKTQKMKEVLDQAVDHFEQTTGITWPFKDEV